MLFLWTKQRKSNFTIGIIEAENEQKAKEIVAETEIGCEKEVFEKQGKLDQWFGILSNCLRRVEVCAINDLNGITIEKYEEEEG
jgi:hypothetical protein